MPLDELESAETEGDILVDETGTSSTDALVAPLQADEVVVAGGRKSWVPALVTITGLLVHQALRRRSRQRSGQREQQRDDALSSLPPGLASEPAPLAVGDAPAAVGATTVVASAAGPTPLDWASLSSAAPAVRDTPAAVEETPTASSAAGPTLLDWTSMSSAALADPMAAAVAPVENTGTTELTSDAELLPSSEEEAAPADAAPDPASEQVLLTNEVNEPVGATARSRMRRENLWHRATYVLVFTPERDRIYVQKRTLSKDLHPGMYDAAAGGVVLADETYWEGAQRELAEEMGLTLPLERIGPIRFESDSTRVFGEVFACVYDPAAEPPQHIQPQEEEVDAVELLRVEEVLSGEGGREFTKDTLLALDLYLRSPANEDDEKGDTRVTTADDESNEIDEEASGLPAITEAEMGAAAAANDESSEVGEEVSGEDDQVVGGEATEELQPMAMIAEISSTSSSSQVLLPPSKGAVFEPVDPAGEPATTLPRPPTSDTWAVDATTATKPSSSTPPPARVVSVSPRPASCEHPRDRAFASQIA
eukprot:ctg_871.g217